MRRVGGGRGFSLIELLVVLVVMMILASVMLPVLRHARERGRRAQCQNNLRQLGNELILFSRAAGSSKPDPSVPSPPGTNVTDPRTAYSELLPWRFLYALSILNAIPAQRADPSIVQYFLFYVVTPGGGVQPVYSSQGLGQLYPKHLTDVKIFYCPSSTVWNPGNAWPSKTLDCYCTYNTREGGFQHPTISWIAYYFVYPKMCYEVKNIAYICCASWNGYSGHQDGWNVWFLDGSVLWQPKNGTIENLRGAQWFYDPDPTKLYTGVWRRFDRLRYD